MVEVLLLFGNISGRWKQFFFAKCGNVPSTNGRPFVRISIIVIFIINTWINEAFVWACVHSIKMCNDNVKEDILLEIRNCRVNRLYYVFIFLEVIQWNFASISFGKTDLLIFEALLCARRTHLQYFSGNESFSRSQSNENHSSIFSLPRLRLWENTIE